MEQTSYSPKAAISGDRIGAALYRVSQTILVAMVGLLPLFFIPGMASFVGGTKVFFVLLTLVVVVILASLAMLRSGVVPLRFSPLILAWWGIVLAAAIAGALAPQINVAFLGEALEVHTVAFLAIMGILMTAMHLMREAGKQVVYLYLMLFASAGIFGIVHVLRAVFGADWLTFGVLLAPTSTMVGSFNDLAIYLVLTILIILITLVQLNLPRFLIAALSTVVVLSLTLLAVISFSTTWIVLSLFSLLLLMYTLTRDRFGDAGGRKDTAAPSLPATLVTVTVFIVATVFLVGGSSLSGSISRATGVSYIEVRPSLGATLTILREVYSDNAFTGAGPNHFGEAWTQHKDRALNETLFWETNFAAGSGYVPTWLVTTGLLGFLTWLTFLGLFIYTGAQALLRAKVDNAFWYFVATVTFVSGLFIWGVSVLYVPGPVILLLGAMSTGLLVVAHQVLVPKQYPTINLLTSARTGFVLIAVVMVVIIASILVGYQGTRQLMAAQSYLSTLSGNKGTEPAAVTAGLVQAFQYYPSDVYARDIASYQLAIMNNLLQGGEPGTTQQQQFQQALSASLEAANEAVRLRPTEARNWRLLGDIYVTLAALQIDGAAARASEAFVKAAELDPNNPYYALQNAILAISASDVEKARTELNQALQLKSNYTDALYLLSQLDIAGGNIDTAITTTRSLISLEPNNPGRYYQLGVLLSSKKEGAAAIDAFSSAITLNPQFANAMYLRALEYFAAGQRELALTELRAVRDLNESNAGLTTLIEQIERNEITPETINTPQTQTIAEPEVVSSDEEVTTTTESPESDLLNPVNTVNEDETSSSTQEAQ